MPYLKFAKKYIKNHYPPEEITLTREYMKEKTSAIYQGWALVNRPSNEFFILFRANREEVEEIREKIVPITGKFEIIAVEVREAPPRDKH